MHCDACVCVQFGVTPLLGAVYQNASDCALLLMSHGASFTVRAKVPTVAPRPRSVLSLPPAVHPVCLCHVDAVPSVCFPSLCALRGLNAFCR